MEGLETLTEMGFNQSRAEHALKLCNNDVVKAMEWMVAHQDEEIPMSSSQDSASTSTEQEEPAPQAKSLKCDECEKLFANNNEVEFHAAKTGHASFSESMDEKKPLTEEEKQEKLKQIEKFMKERRKEREQQEKQEAIEREKKRIQMGKDITLIKHQTAEKEMKQLAEQKKREKKEDKLAREKVRRDIERDRQARKEKFRYEGSSTETAPVIEAPKPTPAVSAPVKNYEKTRLQIRLPSGPPIVQEFQSKEPLSAVRLWITINRTDNAASDSFKLSTTYPRKIFSEEDMEKPLDVLGLVPSAVLVLTR